jgi:NTE family protein
VTSQAFGFLTVGNAERSAALADLVIRPDLEGVDSGNFGDIAEAIGRGETAANAEEAALARFSSEAWDPSRRAAPAFPDFPIASLQVEGNERVDSRAILARAGLHEGEPFQVPRVRLALRRVYGTSDFQWVRFGLTEEEDKTGVVFRVREKPWGPTYLHFGLEIADDLEGQADYVVKANLTRTNLNRRGGEWRNDVQVGSRPGWRTELFQPLDYRGHYFVAPWAVTIRSRTPIYEDGNRIASYTVDENRVQLDGGVEYGRWGEIRLGVYRSRVHAEVDTGPPALPTFDVDGGGVAFQVGFDNLDRPAIPRHGSSAVLFALFSRDSLGAEESYDRVEFVASHFRGRGRHTGFAVLSYGTNLGSELPAYDTFTLGGLFSLGGYSEGELRGQVLAGVSGGYHFRLANLPSGLGQGLYVGVDVDAANVWQSTSEVSVSDLLYGVTLLLGADTLVGPVFLGYGYAEGGHDRLYLTVGRSF